MSKERYTWAQKITYVWYYTLLLFKQQKKKRNRKEKIAAIVLSWKRPKNLPLVVYGLKNQSFIDDIFIFHNHPSKTKVPGCMNIYSQTNKGCIARHEFAATLKDYDYFVFSDDDLMLTSDHGEHTLPAIQQYGKESVLGFFGQQLNASKPEQPYSQGISTTSTDTVTPIDIVKGRIHIISQEGINIIAESDLESAILRSEDDIRANIALQRYFKHPSYVLPLKNFKELDDMHAREHRSSHLEYRDAAIQEGLQHDWSPTSHKTHHA